MYSKEKTREVDPEVKEQTGKKIMLEIISCCSPSLLALVWTLLLAIGSETTLRKCHRNQCNAIG